MAEQIVSPLWELLTSSTIEEIQQEIKLVAGVDSEVERLKRHLRLIQAVLLDAGDKPVKESAVRIWLDQLKYIAYDIEDVLDRWNTAMMKLRMEGGNENAIVPRKKVRFLLPWNCFGIKEVVLRHNIAHKIKEVNERLEEIAKEKDMYNNPNVIRSFETIERIHTVSLIDESEIYGRDDEKSVLLNKLLSESSDENTRPYVISIVGMGGLGKTTLAQVAYDSVKNNFDKAIWVCVSDTFDKLRIAKAIIDGLKVPAPNSGELEALMHCICEAITNKKILLVLDDVWNHQKWKPFELCLKSCSHKSRILITTRKLNVAQMMSSNDDIITIKELSEEYCWSLFQRIAFDGRSERESKKLEDIGRKIVGKCKGLPLAAKTIGSLLRFKKTRKEWRQILDSEIWKLEEFEEDVFNPLLLSYNDLPHFAVKQCFLYCSVFPKDFIIKKDPLIKLWMAQGYLELDPNYEMEDNGEKYFNHLATRSFFQEFYKDENNNIIECKMHDIVHDFAQFLSKNEYFTMELYDDRQPSIDPLQQEKVHHSMVIVSEIEYLNFISSFKKLRSLLVAVKFKHSTNLANIMLQKLFDKLTYLRALDFGLNEISVVVVEKIPVEIGHLAYLRYLNLSRQRFKSLPETLCDLHHLQTLDITYCNALEELPQGIGKLINLRHLLNEGTGSLRYIPIGMERLTCLRSLREFVVSGVDDDSKACTPKSLNNLIHLSGSLRIKALWRLSLMGETRLFELTNLENIDSLELYFDKDIDETDIVDKDETDIDEKVLEALQPHPNLEELCIWGYKGSNFSPSWMRLLTNLRIIMLTGSEQTCEHLAPLGKLKFLELLVLVGMGGRSVYNEFWGIESDDTSSSPIFFPSLTGLYVGDADWEEWNYNNISEDGETNITIMPSLVSLDIDSCVRLKTLPDIFLQSATLKELIINNNCTLLEERYNKQTGDDWPKISHIPNIIINEKDQHD